MELLDGVDLEQLVREHGPLPAERVSHILRQACASLAEAHARGIIHRDIKPANIYLCRRALEHDVVKVLDFGLVKRSRSDGAAGAVVTHPELVTGTPAYLAPETTMSGVVDQRADLYALGCVGFWLLTGRLVFEAATLTAMLVGARRRRRHPGRAPWRHFLCPRGWIVCCSIVWRRTLLRVPRAPPPLPSGWRRSPSLGHGRRKLRHNGGA